MVNRMCSAYRMVRALSNPSAPSGEAGSVMMSARRQPRRHVPDASKWRISDPIRLIARSHIQPRGTPNARHSPWRLAARCGSSRQRAMRVPAWVEGAVTASSLR